MRLSLTLLAAALLSAAPAFAQGPDVHSFDTSISPCADFFTYVNGPWVAKTELPPTRPRIGSFDQLRINNDAILNQALTDLASDPKLQTTPGLKLAATAFAAGMNEASIEAHGTRAIQPMLARINALSKPEQLAGLLAAFNRLDLSAPMSASVRADPKNTSHNVLTLSQGGLGLPDRDDYFKQDAKTQALRAAYLRYAKALFTAANLDISDDMLTLLMALETKLADATKPRAELRDPNASYNPMSPTDLAKAAPGLDWQAYLDVLTERGGKQGVDRLIVGQPNFAKRVGELTAGAPPAVWRTYLTMRLLDAMADRLPKPFAQASFDYHETTIKGVKTPPPRQETVILALGGRTGREPLGMAIGEAFVWRAFSPLAQKRATALIGDVKQAMSERISKVEWMSPDTKKKALEKLAAMTPQIGAPEKFPLYEGLSLAADDYAGNTLRVAEWNSAQRMADLDKPVDRTRWSMAPYIVNAQAGGLNQITFPAGILQPPFFDAKADDAVNYGGIGFVIGHEITHHFDDSGRNFDAGGALKDWWTADDAAAYKKRADRVAALYGSFEPLPGEHVNGRLTLGENISDMSGINIAFEAFQNSLKRTHMMAKIDGFTPDQRFFLSAATIWRSKQSEASLINQLHTDPHSPARYRVFAPLSNSAYFAQSFSCKAGDAMVAPEPISVW
ncbi:MAG TPA: M13 family metallopeptidase [Burkholderiaceae bacterium]|jgi:predicted metalloendopeptidase